jgi:hypothetical protein
MGSSLAQRGISAKDPVDRFLYVEAFGLSTGEIAQRK